MKKIFDCIFRRNAAIKELYAIDRIENGIMVMEKLSDMTVIEYPFSEGFHEGDIVEVTFDNKESVVGIIVDKEKTTLKKRENSKKLRSLFDN